MKKLLILSIFFQSCFFKPNIVGGVTKPEPNNDTTYIEVVKEIFKPIEKLVYSNCNDTAYLLTIESLQRSLDSAKSTKEKRIIIKQIREVLSQRDARELKEQKESNKLAISQNKELTERIIVLQKMLKQKEKTERVEARQGRKCGHWWIILLLAFSTIFFFIAWLKK